MKLARYGAEGQERPVAIDANGMAPDLKEVVPDIANSVLSNDRLAALGGWSTV